MRNKTNYYFKLCDFYYQISFHPSFERDYKNKVLAIIKAAEFDFLSHKPRYTDCVLYFDVLDSKKIIVKKQDRFFISLLKKKNKKKYQIFFIDNKHTLFLIIRITLFHLLAENNGFLIHASAVADFDKVLIFLGRSGSGKTTVSNILGRKFKKIADDIVAIRNIKGIYYAYSLKVIEKNDNGIDTRKFKIKRIFLIEKIRKFHRISLIEDKNKRLDYLLKQVLILNDSKVDVRAINNWLRFIKLNKIYLLKFSLNKEEKLVETFLELS